ncbi:MAG TPA: SdpI family protein [Longimicrobiales bacterium]|nr:SdpI family protein [Longimicrobiales bacterium]
MSRRWLGPVVIVAMAVFVAVVYGRLPARIPVHWNTAGEVSEWRSRGWAWLLPALAAALRLLLPLLRRIDPRREHYQRFDETFWIVVNVVILLFAAVEVATLGYALGWPMDPTQVILAIVGVSLLVLGNYMPRVRSNWWIGVRTPWTLSSEQVWRETHRLAGKTFVLGGLVVLAALPLRPPLRAWVVVSGIALASGVPAVYSYFSWRRVMRNG